jgi:hypothetical protein
MIKTKKSDTKELAKHLGQRVIEIRMDVILELSEEKQELFSTEDFAPTAERSFGKVLLRFMA